MVSFIVVFLFAPVLAWFTWMYTSPMPRYTPVNVILRLPWGVAMIGGLFAQLIFLAHHEPLKNIRFYILALLVIEGIPLLFLLIYLAPKWIGSKPVWPEWRTDGYGKKGDK